MTSKSPIFPLPEPQHYSDYGFDPQIDFFQVFRETRKQNKRETRSLDAIRFKLKKPISKEETKKRPKNKRRGWWWKSALRFWKWNKVSNEESGHHPTPYRAVLGPVYSTESDGPSWAYRSNRAGSGSMAAAEVGEVEIPYLSLRDLNVMEGNRVSTSAPRAMPIYLVT